MPTPPPYPVFFLLEEKKCLVAGGGNVALRKIGDLVACGARVTVVADSPLPEIEKLAAEGTIRLVRRRFETSDTAGAAIVIAATNDDSVNAAVADDARSNGIPVNVVDDPGASDFISGAVTRRGPLVIAVSTSGCGPLIAAGVRKELDERYGEPFGEYVAFAGELRTFILSAESGAEKKAEALEWVAGPAAFELFGRSGQETVWREVRTILFSS
jgi:precorrin-2 dehydrogenase / sirohydrochlorin ferrochelatase